MICDVFVSIVQVQDLETIILLVVCKQISSCVSNATYYNVD